MADGWDLHAVVSGCTAAASSSSARTATRTVNCQTNKVEDPLTDLASLTFTDDDDDITPFYQPSSGDNSDFEFQGLEEIYRSYNHLKPLPNNPSTISQQQTQLPPPPPPQKMVQQLISTPGQLIKNSRAGSSLTLPGVRSRRRKNQQTKLVRQMTHEELLSDSWAWRKYGQKPIKGSPYPRNYYRCSTSKGCGARKQVEKSPSDPDIFIVSYSGEHTHPRPTHRNSLAGTTRTKFSSRPSTPATVTSSDPPSLAAVPNPPCSSWSPVSPSSLSPSTPLVEGESNQRETIEIVDEEEEEMEEADDEDIDLIPNTVMSEDILKGFEELRRASLSRWTQNSSAAAGGGGAGGGCC